MALPLSLCVYVERMEYLKYLNIELTINEFLNFNIESVYKLSEILFIIFINRWYIKNNYEI